jgi:hypothetical protein
MPLIVYLFSSIFFLLPLPSWSQPVEENELTHSSPTLFCLITPPKNWEIADPQYLSPSVQVAFMKKGGSGISPSINLAVETTNLSLPDYLKVVRQIHESDRRNRWRKLGKIHTSSGIGQLTEIDTTTEFGSIRMLQLILTKQGRAYVVTAAALKDEIAQYYSDFQATFRSLQITSDLISTVPQMERRDFLKSRIDLLFSKMSDQSIAFNHSSFEQDHWVPFQDIILKSFEDMGAHWQLLMLKNTHEKALALLPPPQAQPELAMQSEEEQLEVESPLSTDRQIACQEPDSLTRSSPSEQESLLESGQNSLQPL